MRREGNGVVGGEVFRGESNALSCLSYVWTTREIWERLARPETASAEAVVGLNKITILTFISTRTILTQFPVTTVKWHFLKNVSKYQWRRKNDHEDGFG